MKIKNKKIKILKWADGDMDAWLVARQQMEGCGQEYVRIGASDISVVMGTNKWKEKRRLFQHLTGEYSRAQITERLLAGHLAEPLIAQRWESFTADDEIQTWKDTLNGVKVRKLQDAKFFLTHDDYPNFFISLDYIPGDENQYSPFTGELYDILTPHEFKTTNKDYYRLWANGITAAYYDQVQAQMLLTDTKVAVFHVLIDGVQYKVREVDRDEKRIAEIIEEVNKFVALVIDGKAVYKGILEAPNEEMRAQFQELYDSMLPDFNGTQDGVDLADELWKAPIDPDVSFKKGNVKDDNLMSEYWNYLRLEEEVKKNKFEIQATLKTRSSGFEGIITANFKMINRGNNGLKGKYFKISPLKKELEITE